MKTESIIRIWVTIILSIFIMTFAGCSSSEEGGEDSTSDTGGSSQPTANAGSDQTVDTGSTVTLDGSASSDPDGDTLYFGWLITSQPTDGSTDLSGDTTARPTFVPNVDGVYVISLGVSDVSVDINADSSTDGSTDISSSNVASDTVSITAITGYSNNTPTADAGDDQSVKSGETATLDGTGSSDQDNDGLTYQWSITSKPSGSTADLSGDTSDRPTLATDKKGEFIISLVVNDGIANSAADEVIVTATNNPPVANAGPDKEASFDEMLIDASILNKNISFQMDIGPSSANASLDGSGSYDPDGDALTYYWEFKTNPEGNTSLSDVTSDSPLFSTDTVDNYIILLTVSDGEFDATDEVTVTVDAGGEGLLR